MGRNVFDYLTGAPLSSLTGSCVLAGLHTLRGAGLCHRAGAAGRAGGGGPQDVGADAGGAT